MRKFIAVIAILVSSFGFISAASPAVASAANCHVGQSFTTWQAAGNWLNFYGYVNGCTDVDMVQQSSVLGTPPFWQDVSVWGSHVAPSPPALAEVLCGRQYTTFTDSCGTTYYTHPWCGGLTHTIYTVFYLRIHNKTQQTWGNWYSSTSANYAIVC